MPWTESALGADIIAGPFQLAQGSAGSETSLGDITDLKVTIGYETENIYGGAFFGTATIIDQVFTGVTVSATFGLLQHIGDLNKVVPALAAPGNVLSTGPTSKTLTLDVDVICGTVATDYDARWVLHKRSVASEADTSYDIVFPAAVVYFAPEEFGAMGDDGHLIIPCKLVAFPDSNKDIVIIGKDAA